MSSRYSKNGMNGNGSMGSYGQSRPHRDYNEPTSKTNVFIRGLTTETSDNDLYDLCSKYGTIVSTKSIIDRLSNECKGYGFVNFENPDDATVAVRELTLNGYQARMSKENMGRSDRSPFDRSSPPEFKRGYPRFNGNGAANGAEGGRGMRRLSKTNLYLRGLGTNTTDEELQQLCGRLVFQLS
jgi:RNA recognition motif-containing protein